MPATMHLLHGLPGSGKTTFAATLAKRTGAEVFSPDTWMVARHGSNPPEAEFPRFKAEIEAEIWSRVEILLRQGRDVILDAGFWTRAERETARRRAVDTGATPKLYWLQASDDVMLQRVLHRSAAHPDSALQINEAAFRVFQTRFEPLGSDEPHIVVPT